MFEQINHELKTELGLGEHQVSKEEGRIERSFGMAVLAYLLLIRACHQEMLPGEAWSAPQLRSGTRPRALQCAPKAPKFIVCHMNVSRRYNCPYHQAHGHSPAIIEETERTYDEGR